MDNEPIEANQPTQPRTHRVLRSCLVLLVIAGIIGGTLFRRGCEAWRRDDCRCDLRQLGLLCRMYAEYHGAFPSRWSDLVIIDGATNSQFYCPSAGHKPGTWENVDLWADYRLAPNLRTNAPPDTVLAIEPLANHRGDGANVLFVDGHVEWWTAIQIENRKNNIRNPEPTSPGDVATRAAPEK
jgi:prepilin-type processing-associated H-X9-DG protein